MPEDRTEELSGRRPALIATSVSADVDGAATVLGTDVLQLASEHSFAWLVASMTLGRPITSKQLEEFVDFVLRLLVDHGPYVSGALNTIVTARAGIILSLSDEVRNAAVLKQVFGLKPGRKPGQLVQCNRLIPRG